MKPILAATCLATMLLSASAASANTYTNVASSFDDDDNFDLNISLDYRLDLGRGKIAREASGTGAVDGAVPVREELSLSSSRHLLIPRIELGIFHDISFSATIPIVIKDSRSLSFVSGVDRTSATTIRDGLLGNDGFDADNPADGFTDPTDPMIFRSPSRSGIDQIHLGLSWAPMNQARDDSKPTWKIDAELRVPVGKIMTLDRDNPAATTGVGRGLYEIRLATSFAKRAGWAEPYLELWWLTPVSQTSRSLFQDPGFGAVRPGAQQRAGARFGFHTIPWERKETGSRVSFDMGMRLESFFEGRTYSPMWEVFQYAGKAGSGGPLVLDGDPTDPADNLLDHPGITSVENHLLMSGVFGLHAQIGDTIQFGASFEVAKRQNHVITFTDAGTDGSDDNLVVDPNTEEVSPIYVPLIDTVGNRYHVQGMYTFSLLMNARVLF